MKARTSQKHKGYRCYLQPSNHFSSDRRTYCRDCQMSKMWGRHR